MFSSDIFLLRKLKFHNSYIVIFYILSLIFSRDHYKWLSFSCDSSCALLLIFVMATHDPSLDGICTRQ